MDFDNTTSFCDEKDPNATAWLEEIFEDKSLTAWFITLIVCTVVVCIFYIEALIHIGIKVSHKGRRLSIFWILSMCPVFCVTSLIGFCLPRGMVLCNIMAALFGAIGLYFFLLLMIYYYGGDEAAVMKLTHTNVPLLCFKTITLREASLFWIRMWIGQFVVIRSALLYLEAMLWMDGSLNLSKITFNDATIYIYVITLASAVGSILGLLVFLSASRKHLYNYYIAPKVWLMIVVLLISNLQVVILGILASAGVLPCKKPFHTEMRAHYWQSLLLTLESTLLYPIFLLYYRTKKGNVVGVLDLSERPRPSKFYKPRGKSSLHNVYTVL